MSFDSITNRGEFFSNHYLEAVLASDLGDLRSTWDAAEARGEQTGRSRLKGGAAAFFAARADANEASPSNANDALRRLHNVVLGLLGFEPDRTDLEFKQNTEYLLGVPVAAKVETSTGLLLVAIEAGNAPAVDDLFDFDERQLHTGVDQPGALRHRVFRNVDKRAVHAAADAVGEIYNTDEPPRYVLVLGGSVVLLAERAKWSEGRFLAVDLGLAFDRNDTSAKGELETIAALFSADALVPVDGQSAIERLVDKSHKHAVGVSKELRTGIRESIEIIANEVIAQRDAQARERNQKLFTRSDVDARDLTRQALRYLYRLIVLLYAESRPELGIVPADDPDYVDGYSLDRLRELCLVDLTDDHSRNGSHFQQSLDRLFELVNGGYHAEHAVQQLPLAGAEDAGLDDLERRSTELYIQFPGLDAELFSPESTKLINEVPLRNEALQQVLRKLMLAPGKRRNDAAGFISYAQLGINQLGAVYEGLMAYTGFYANTDLYEVAKGGDPTDGTWMLPVADADEYPDDVFVRTTDEVTGRKQRVMHPQGSFVFRLSGRDRQRSASYYTPEVLTRCVVKHALAELLGLDDYAPEHGSSGITNAVDMLNLTICEPALGSGAFANEAINQLSAEYLRRREAELGEVLNPARRDLELQKVKAHFALHQTYGVDLNATAVELAEVSLWLNAMYPGLKAPWFGLQLRQGNSLIGCRRATWTTSQLGDRPWANTKKGSVQPPVDRKLSEKLNANEIHHFLLPGHGWAAVAGRKEAEELRPDGVESLKAWRTTILAAPKKTDSKRLTALADGVEALWASAAKLIAVTQQGLRRTIDVYGAKVVGANIPVSRAEAERALRDENSPLGRLRTLMDAWVGLWFWPLDCGHRPPSWEQWLAVVEELVRPDERHGLTGQLDLFDDLAGLLEAQQRLSIGQTTVAQLKESHPWLATATSAARREGAWHWSLEFAPAFANGGFDLQVGNPPWVKVTWEESAVLAELDPWWMVLQKRSAQERNARRALDMSVPEVRDIYLSEAASAEGLLSQVNSPVLHPLLVGAQTNLYTVFMDTVWRHGNFSGVAGLLHPEGHFTEPKATAIRREAYQRLRLHLHFFNDLLLFEEIGTTREFGIHIYGCAGATRFRQVGQLLHPSTGTLSLSHDGSGEIPALQFAGGGWDLRPHYERVVEVNEGVLLDWALLFDDVGTPALEARLLKPVTTADLAALKALAQQPTRLGDRDFYWTRGLEEDTAKEDGLIRWETKIPSVLEDVVLQTPHFSVANPFSKQANENCKSHQDYSLLDLESLPSRFVPRTNYQRVASPEIYKASVDIWGDRPANSYFRLAWGRRTDIGTERTLQSAIISPGPLHVDMVLAAGSDDVATMCLAAAFWATLPIDYQVRVLGKDVRFDTARKLPLPRLSKREAQPLLLRILRLNCLTASYSPLWEELWDPDWKQDRWTDPGFDRVAIGEAPAEWTTVVPLRRDFERRLALVELDALAALLLGVTAGQLRAMYRTQFAVLRKYEQKMAFDSEGRKLCGFHQSAGYLQSYLQGLAKAGALPKQWSSMWSLYEQFEDDPSSVDWLGHYSPPFYRPDREAEMTRAYMEFERRFAAEE